MMTNSLKKHACPYENIQATNMLTNNYLDPFLRFKKDSNSSSSSAGLLATSFFNLLPLLVPLTLLLLVLDLVPVLEIACVPVLVADCFVLPVTGDPIGELATLGAAAFFFVATPSVDLSSLAIALELIAPLREFPRPIGSGTSTALTTLFLQSHHRSEPQQPY